MDRTAGDEVDKMQSFETLFPLFIFSQKLEEGYYVRVRTGKRH